MIERRDGASFAVEALFGFGALRKVVGQDFYGDGAIEASVEGAIDLAHTAGTERRLDFVRTEFGARGEGHQWAEL